MGCQVKRLQSSEHNLRSLSVICFNQGTILYLLFCYTLGWINHTSASGSSVMSVCSTECFYAICHERLDLTLILIYKRSG